jgi:Uma2 family endonuclease
LLKQIFPRPGYSFSGAGIVTSRTPLTVRVPDIAIYESASLNLRQTYLHSPPVLAVEVLSPYTRRHIQRKLQDYANARVAEIWLVSPEGQTVEVLLAEADGYRTPAVLNDGEVRPAASPESGVSVAAIFANS